MNLKSIFINLVNRAAFAAVVIAMSAASSLVVAGPYSDAVLADNPVAYYRLDESTGTNAANIGTGAGIDGAYVNIPGATTDNSSAYGEPGPRSPNFPGLEANNNAVELDPEDTSGNTDTTFPRVEVSVDDTGTSPLAITGALTLEAWIRRDEDLFSPSNNEGIVSRYRQDQNGAARSYVMYFDSGTDGSNGTPDGTPGIGMALSSTGGFQGANTYEFAANIPIGEWVHVATVFEPGVRVAAYVNGVKAGEVIDDDVVDTASDFQILDVPLYSGEGDLWIGQQFNGNAAWSFEGGIDEVAIYNAALSDLQIADHYAAAIPEPSAIMLLMLGSGTALVSSRRRRSH